jgi:hypothetical protein
VLTVFLSVIMSPLPANRREQLLRAARKLASENRGAPSTLRTRSHAVKSWKRFAGTAIPDEELVWLYVVQEIGRNRKPKGIKTYIAGIKKHFRLRQPGFSESVFTSARIKDAFWQGASRLRKAGVITKRAVVVKESQVRDLCSKARSYDELLVAALVVVLFFNLTRGAELVLPAHTRSQEYNKIPLVGNAAFSVAKARIRILSQKNDQYRATNLEFTARNSPEWARKILFKYLAARSDKKNGLRSLPELFVRADGVLPTTAWLMRKVKAAWGEAHTIHGLRAGGATRMALLGYSAFYIQLAGRWSSDAFLAYIGEHEELAAALAARNNLPTGRVKRRRH